MMQSTSVGPVVVRNEVSETHFGFYSEAEMKSVSVCKVNSSVAYDALGNTLSGGLYDGRMGPRVQNETCLTCGMNGKDCPGHMGHIELDVPVYHPLLFPHLFQLLRTSCAFCHGLKMSKARCRTFLIKLKLYEMNEIEAAQTLDDQMLPPTMWVDAENTAELDLEDKLKTYEKRYEQYCRMVRGSKGRSKLILSGISKRGQQETMVQFQKEAAGIKKCENCSAQSPAYRKDGCSKIFRKPLSTRMKQEVAGSQRRMTNALEVANRALAAPLGNDGRPLDGFEVDNDEEEEEEEEDEDDDDDDDEEIFAKKGKGAKKKSTTSNTKTTGAKKSDKDDKSEKEPDKVVTPEEVQAIIQALWIANAELLHFIWGRPYRSVQRMPPSLDDPEAHLGYRIFFSRCLFVPANRFRPEAHVGGRTTESPQNSYLSKVIQLNDDIVKLMRAGKQAKHDKLIADATAKAKEARRSSGGKGKDCSSSSSSSSDDDSDDGGKGAKEKKRNEKPPSTPGGDSSLLPRIMGLWIQLQDAVNCYMDSAKDPNLNAALKGQVPGIRQVLERKEGMFRMNMMGKRVNFCCRSVISPDPYIGTNEIGIPKHFAMGLHYPEPVNAHNARHLRTLVERGADEYPGANFLEKPSGQLISLEKLTPQDRAAKAKLLLNEPGYKVYRHLVNGDTVLMNRQPSLHKPSIMAHRVRVLPLVKEQTLRMNYANCNAYNADFDGDEMNCHFVQSELARAEANYIVNTDNQYIVPTSGNPLRGLIQDHVASGVKLTCKDTFLTKAQFQQLVFIAVSGLQGTEIMTHADRILIPPPAVVRPVERWTGKQVISSLLHCLCQPPLPQLNLEGKTRTPPTALGADSNEHIVLIRNGFLLSGVMDKASIGNASLGVVHAVYELFGSDYAGKLLNAFGRLFTYHLQNAGHTCGIEDLTLTSSADEERRALLKKVAVEAQHGLANFLANDDGAGAGVAGEELTEFSEERRLDCEQRLAALSATDRKGTKIHLDGVIQGVINKAASNVIKACLPNGLEQPFLRNNFSIMVLTGAKGSSVNQSQISCFLGQQALEGQRVPQMVSGKTLPSFRAYDSSARAGGFVQDRFLTGVKPQEFYFHCMAGREGLVDTAVKTSRSGYL